jgi:hypothetical protein
MIGADGGASGTGFLPGSGSVIETSHTLTARKKMRFSPVSSPLSSRPLTATGARIRIAGCPLRTQRLSARKARKPATYVGVMPRAWHSQAISHWLRRLLYGRQNGVVDVVLP